MTDYEKEIIKKASLEDLIELRMDIIPVSYYDKCATHKDGIIKELKQRLEKLEKEHCSYITEVLPSGHCVFKPNFNYLQPYSKEYSVDYNRILNFFDEVRYSIGIHYEFYYSKTLDWWVKIYRKGVMPDGSDEEIFFEQHCDMDYIFSAAYAALRKYAKDNGMQLEEL